MNANIFKEETTNASIDSNQFFFLRKFGYSRSCLASVYFNNRQSLKLNEIEIVTLSLSQLLLL